VHRVRFITQTLRYIMPVIGLIFTKPLNIP